MYSLELEERKEEGRKAEGRKEEGIKAGKMVKI